MKKTDNYIAFYILGASFMVIGSVYMGKNFTYAASFFGLGITFFIIALGSRQAKKKKQKS